MTRGQVRKVREYVNTSDSSKDNESAGSDTLRLFQTMANSAPVLLWMAGIDAKCTFFNQRWLEFTGRPLALELGDGWAEGVHPEDFQRCMDCYLSAFASRTPFRMEYRLRRADGDYRWLLDEGIPHFMPDGTFTGFIGSCIDITDLRATQEALEHRVRERTSALKQSYIEIQEREARLAEAQRIGNIGHWEIDVATGKAAWSDQMFRLFGVPREGFSPTLESILEKVHPTDRERIRKLTQNAIRSGLPYQCEHRINRPDGLVRLIDLRINPRVDSTGRTFKLVGTAQDVTERKEVEEARVRLAQERAARIEPETGRRRAAYLAQASAELSATLNYSETVDRISKIGIPYFGNLCGVEIMWEGVESREIALNSSDPSHSELLTELKTLLMASKTHFWGMEDGLRIGKHVCAKEVASDRFDWSVYEPRCRTLVKALGIRMGMVAPLVVRNRTIGAIVFASTNRSRSYDWEDKSLATDLAHRASSALENARLYHDLVASQRALERQARQLTRSNRELENFAYAASHDLRAPLRAIDMLSEWIETDLADTMGDKSRNQMELLRGRVRRMTQLLNDLLDYCRVGRETAGIEVVELDELISEIGDLLNIDRVRTLHVEAPLRFETAKGLFKRVLMNIIENSIKHSEGKCITVRVTWTEHNDFYEFSIMDNGPGIPAMFRERVFQMFQTLKPRDRVEGSGMGLAFVKGIIEGAEGTVTAESNSEGGTTIHFTWPKQWKPMSPSTSH